MDVCCTEYLPLRAVARGVLGCFAKATPFRFRAAVLEMMRPIAIETSHIRANVGKVAASIAFSAGCDLSSMMHLVQVLAEMDEAFFALV